MTRRRPSLPLLATLLLLAVAAPAESAARRRAVQHRPPAELVIAPLAGSDPALPTHDDLEPLRALIGDAAVVGLGETYHTSAGFYRMKHRIFRFLVEELDFRAFAMENRWQGTETAAAYVATCAGTAEEAITDHIDVWRGEEYADLVRWMCEWNRTHPDPADRLAMFGFDIQQPWYDGPALVTFLETLGIPQSDPRSQGLRSCEQAFGLSYPFGAIPQSVHDTCIGALNAIEIHLQTNRADIVRQTSEDQFTVAMLRVVGLRAWQEHAFLIAHDFAAGYNKRDAGMAYAFHAMRARKAPGAKTVVWAANSHVARNPLPRGEHPLGAHLETALGPDYVTFALTAYDTDVDFPGLGCGPRPRAAGAIEELLNAHGHPTLLAYHRTPTPDTILPMGIDLVRPWHDYDGILFLQHSPRMRPTARPPCR